MDARRMTVVVLDDHPAVVAGVTVWCAAADPPIEVVDARDHLPLVWTGRGAEADVVVFDLQLGGKPPAFAELEALVRAGRQVVVYSQHSAPATVVRCLDLGALAYLTKAEGPEHLVPALQAAAEGVHYLSPSLGGALCAVPDGRARLTPREVEVLTAWFECASKDLVAARLHITRKTVETYIERVRAKYAELGRPAATKQALVKRALEDGLVSFDDLP